MYPSDPTAVCTSSSASCSSAPLPSTSGVPAAVPDASLQVQNGNACLDWRVIVALGVPESDAKTMVKELSARHMIKRYRWLLIQLGLDQHEASSVAQAIAYHDTFECRPTVAQQTLIQRHCSAICRAQLWRANLLPPPPLSLVG